MKIILIIFAFAFKSRAWNIAINTMKNKIYSLLVIAVVVVLHFCLGWGISHLTLRPHLELQSFANQLQMVEVNLGSSSPSVIESQQIESMPTELPKTPVIEPKPLLEQDDHRVEPDPILAVGDGSQPLVKQKSVRKVELIKPKKPTKKTSEVQLTKNIKVKARAKTQAISTKTAVLKTHQVKSSGNELSQENQQENGSSKGKAQAEFTRGNNAVSASLGAGFGNAMRGQCSDLSDSEEDTGQVKLLVQIDSNGKALAVSVVKSSGIKRLDNQATRMAFEHRFQAAKVNGKAVTSSLTFTIHFACGV